MTQEGNVLYDEQTHNVLFNEQIRPSAHRNESEPLWNGALERIRFAVGQPAAGIEHGFDAFALEAHKDGSN